MRTLSPNGRRQAALVGSLMADAGLVPDVVLCSSAVRTRQTYELLATSLSAPSQVVYSEELYGAGLSGTLAVISTVPASAGTVLVVGHEPVMSGVASVLAGPESDPAALARVRVGVPTGAFSVLEVFSSWSGLTRASAVLVQVVVAPHHL